MRSRRSHPELLCHPALLCGGVALALALGTPLGARAQDACAIEGTLAGVEVVVREARGLRRVRLEAPRRVSVTPVRSGVTEVRALDGEPLAGITRAALRFVVARALSLREGSLELPEGLPLERVAPAARGPWALVDASLGDGLALRRAPLPCDALRVVSEDPPVRARPEVEAQGPRWRARTERLWIFSEPDGRDALRLDVVPGAVARFAETARRGHWVELVLRTTLGARVRAWARDGDLIR